MTKDRLRSHRDEIQQAALHQFAGLLRIVGQANAEEVVHIRAKSTVGQMRVENPDEFRASGVAALLLQVVEKGLDNERRVHRGLVGRQRPIEVE